MDILDRFWSHVDKSAGPEGCWPWTGSKRNEAGYGAFRIGEKIHVAHRWLLGHLRGTPLSWPEEVGCHKCDNKQCCNPAHLYVGTHSQNTLDAADRGTHPARAEREKTHCVNGHEYTPENTHFFGPDKRWRYCRTCKRDMSRESAKARRRREKSG